MDYAIDEETAEEAGDLILSMIEGLNGVNLQWSPRWRRYWTWRGCSWNDRGAGIRHLREE
jgi:hypothetical protein